jgi:hypothetical protein
MIKFICAFGANAFGLSLVPVTYMETYLSKGKEATEREYLDAMSKPNDTDYVATLKKARDMCEGGTVQFA